MTDFNGKPLNHNEMLEMELVYALHSKCVEMDCLEKRMRSLNVWQYYKCALGLLTKVERALLMSLCDRNLRHMEEVRERYIVHLQPKPVIGKLSSDHIVSSADLQLLCECAIRDKCTYCLNDTRKEKKCPYRNIFLQIAPPDEVMDNGLCEYARMKTAEENDFFKQIESEE